MASATLKRDALPAATIALVVAAVLLMSHPYTGVRHDGVLYAGEALERLFPGQIRDDLYFRFGSQGRFTLMPVVYAGLIAAFGLGWGTKLGLLASLASYAAATAWLVAAVVRPPLRLASVLAVLTGWTLYGGLRMFGYSEAFLTARSFAEPLVLAGLALLVRDRRAAGIAVLLASLLVHPLIGAAGSVVGWLFLASGDRRWWWAGAAGAIALAAAGTIGFGPFVDVFARYDAEWLALVHDVNAQAFVLAWSSLDYGMIVFGATMLAFACKLLEAGSTRRLVAATLVAGLAAFATSFVAVDLLSNPFFGKLQVWRVLWLLQWLAMVMTPTVLVSLWRRDDCGRMTAAILAFGWVAPFSAVPGFVAVMALAVDAFRRRVTISRTTADLVAGAAVVAAAVIAVQYWARLIKLASSTGTPWSSMVGPLLAMNIVLAIAGLGAATWLSRRAWGVAAAALMLVGAFLVWDQRGPWTRELEEHRVGTSIWPGQLAPDAKVYWYRDLIAPWVLLGRANYYTQQQGSGAVFSRDLVVELNRRRQATNLLDFQEQICRMMNNLNEKESACEPDAEAVRAVCENGVDHVVIQSRLDGAAPTASWAPGVVENGYEKKFYLYRCSALKAG